MLPCVRIKCSGCGFEAHLSAGFIPRALGRPLTDHTAALIPKGVGCSHCGSSQVDVYFAHHKIAIVLTGKTPCCRLCGNHIPEQFRATFPNDDFCPLCVAEGLVSDTEVVAAHGMLFSGEAYSLMAIHLRGDEPVQLKWLRKAADEGDINACSTLGDILSRSNDPAEAAEAARAYKIAASGHDPDSTVRYAQHRLALILFRGRGQSADPGTAVELMLSAAKKGASYALSDLGQFYFNGAHGLAQDVEQAFEFYRRAYEMNPNSMSISAAVGLMILDGIGTDPDEEKGKGILRHAISVFADSRPNFDQDACFREVMAVRNLVDDDIAKLPTARIYLDWMRYLKVPVAARLLDRCGGPLPANEPRWELSLSRALPDKVNGDVWWVRSPVRDRLGQPTALGQVEWLPNREWIATTESGVPVGDTFVSVKKAVEALAAAVGCEVPYVAVVTTQTDQFDRPDLFKQVKAFVRSVVASPSRPSPGELITKLDKEVGPKARWDFERVIGAVAEDPKITRSDRDYLASLLAEDGLAKALRGEDAPEPKKTSTIDELFKQSKLYRSSGEFNELVNFMGRFRDYAPYNNMLVRLQNPSCSFYARAEDWRDRFNRHLKEDARPMLILAPMHPVMLVYDLDQTEGADLPKELQDFSKFEGKWDPSWLSNLVENAAGHCIRVDFKSLSSTNGGFATLATRTAEWKMRIAIHDGLDEPSRFGVLCHELAHILLGHLGTDWDRWWPGRLNINRQTAEIEAEAVAHIVTNHLGLKGASIAFADISSEKLWSSNQLP